MRNAWRVNGWNSHVLFSKAGAEQLQYMYTERQKRRITPSYRRSLKSTASKVITFRHRKAIVLLTKHIWKIKKIAFAKKEKNVMKSQKDTFKKSQKMLPENLHDRKAAYSKHSIAIHSISKAGLLKYVTTVLAIVPTELRAQEAGGRRRAVSVIFVKWPLAISPYIIIFWLKQTFFFRCAW